MEDYKLDIGAKSVKRILNDTKPIGNQTKLILNESGTGEVHLDEKNMKKNSKIHCKHSFDLIVSIK